MAEKQLRKYISKLLAGHVSQIESHATAAGIPDTNVSCNNQDHWLELKFGTPQKTWEVRPAQKTWFRRRAKTGARNLWILWRYEDGTNTSHGIIHMAGPRIEAVFSDSSPSFWRYASVSTWGRQIPENELNQILRLI